MTIGDEPLTGGNGDGTGAGEAPVTGPDDEVVDAEVVDDGPGAGGTEEAEAVEADPLEVARAERDDYLDSLRRLQAEFENYKKRVLKQQTDQMARAAAALVDKLLTVLDAMDLATDHVGGADSDEAKALVAASGLLHGVLEKEGLERIDPVGQEFDPTAHEAVGHQPAPEGSEPTASGEPRVTQVMRAGYRWHGTVVRPAMVMVEG
jgi:molecular chaperone GrpE